MNQLSLNGRVLQNGDIEFWGYASPEPAGQITLLIEVPGKPSWFMSSLDGNFLWTETNPGSVGVVVVTLYVDAVETEAVATYPLG